MFGDKTTRKQRLSKPKRNKKFNEITGEPIEDDDRITWKHVLTGIVIIGAFYLWAIIILG